MSVIRALLYDAADQTLLEGGVELLERWSIDSGKTIWVDITGEPDDAENQFLTANFSIPQLAIQDAQRLRHPPKLEIFSAFVFMMLRDLITAYQDSDPVVADLALFIGKNFVVSRHHKEIPSIDKVYTLAGKDKQLMQAGTGHVAYQISRKIVDAYTPEVLALEEYLNDLEDELYESGNDAVIESLSRYNRALKRLRRHLVYQENVMEELCKGTAELPVALNRHEFMDLYENMGRLASLCQLNQELGADLLNTHLSLLSHRLNQVMRVLTIATVIFLPLGLLAGIYGMNFGFMPELGWQFGYFAVLALMATVATTLITIFKRRGWL
ncbi:MAG: magnesium/cobalt transporter CorA [Woeseia sp.]|nr:magnesium/cobalt transporter CorA [Woeseia sp.]MBT8096684.1 magnesium/cobalt transporter CorA [Woeseia sp.]NNE61204.1 magnesium/cobalt transporter CorA [Woeseia sp.]NNL54085.1 magnesium/cobalt transporter CorA [Woeseia sp.]